MKSKAPLVMMEQLIMLLVFALAAALCLRAFVLADGQAEKAALRDRAMLEVQQAAETIKYCRGDMIKAAEILGCTAAENQLKAECEGFELYAERTGSDWEPLGRARVWAEDGSGERLIELELAWQMGGAA